MKLIRNIKAGKVNFLNFLIIIFCFICFSNASSLEKVFKDGDLDVEFGESDTDGMCRTYTIEVEGQSYSSFRLDDCDSLSNVLSIEVAGCSCD